MAAWIVDKPVRSIFKAVSYRLFGSVTTAVISFLLTGSWTASIGIGFLDLFAKIGLFYLHERIWDKLPFGRKKVGADYEI